MCCAVLSHFSHVRLSATSWTIAHDALLSMGFSRQEYWSGLPFPSPGDLRDPGMEPSSPTLQEDSLPTEPPGKSPSLPSWNQIFALFLECEALILGMNLGVHPFLGSKISMPSKHLILCPLLLLPSIFPSIRVFSNESALHIRWPKSWSFCFNICPSNEYSGLIFFSIDWFDLLAVQGTLKSLLQYHSSKASILQCSGFFIVQFSHPYMTTGKTIALTRHTFVGKVMSLLFIMLSRLIITFLPRSKHLLISWLQSPSAVILGPPKMKSVTVAIVSPPICH